MTAPSGSLPRTYATKTKYQNQTENHTYKRNTAKHLTENHTNDRYTAKHKTENHQNDDLTAQNTTENHTNGQCTSQTKAENQTNYKYISGSNAFGRSVTNVFKAVKKRESQTNMGHSSKQCKSNTISQIDKPRNAVSTTEHVEKAVLSVKSPVRLMSKFYHDLKEPKSSSSDLSGYIKIGENMYQPVKRQDTESHKIDETKERRDLEPLEGLHKMVCFV